MRFGAIFRKELSVIFASPVAYVVIAFLLAVPSVWFFIIGDFAGRDVASLRGYFGVLPVLYLLIVPAVTMRSWAEERRAGTAELLWSLPVSLWSLVLAKFMASIVVIGVALVLTLFVPITILPLGYFDPGEIVGQYLGVGLLAAASIGVGTAISAACRNQITAFLITVAALLAFNTVGEIGRVSAVSVSLSQFFNYLSFQYHFASFAKGVIDTRDVVFFCLVGWLSLGVCRYVLLSEKWR